MSSQWCLNINTQNKSIFLPNSEGSFPLLRWVSLHTSFRKCEWRTTLRSSDVPKSGLVLGDPVPLELKYHPSSRVSWPEGRREEPLRHHYSILSFRTRRWSGRRGGYVWRKTRFLWPVRIEKTSFTLVFEGPNTSSPIDPWPFHLSPKGHNRDRSVILGTLQINEDYNEGELKKGSQKRG